MKCKKNLVMNNSYVQNSVFECLEIIGKCYDKRFDRRWLKFNVSKQGKNYGLTELRDLAEKLGLRTQEVSLSFADFRLVQLPCIDHWNNNFVVINEIRKNEIYVYDPLLGQLVYKKMSFLRNVLTGI